MSFTHRLRHLTAALSGVLLIGSLVPGAAAAESRTPLSGKDPAGARASVQAPWWVEWLEAFDSNGNKIDDEAERAAKALISTGKPQATVPLLVTFSRIPAERRAFVDAVAGNNAYFFKTQPVVDVDVPAYAVHRLASFPGVVAVEYDMEVKPALGVSSPATQANRGGEGNDFYNGLTAEDLGYTGRGMVVAVLDTGVQEQQTAFAGKWIAGAHVGFPVPVHCVNPADDDGHGTHVASTAVGSDATEQLYGTAKDAKLVEVKISAGLVSIGGIARGFEFVRLYNEALANGTPLCGPNDDHIDVATLSFGSTGRGGPNAGTDEDFINALVQSGVAVTVAVGNCGPSPSATCSFGDTDNGISSPGNAAGAIGVANGNDVGSVQRADDSISTSSSRGPNSGGGDTTAGGATSATDLKDRYRKPDITAPGTSITAAGLVPGRSSTLSGTSMATPHVAGVAALLLEAGESVKDQTGGVNLMASTANGFTSTNDYAFGQYPVRDALVYAADYTDRGIPDNAQKWTGPNSHGVTWNNTWGYGMTTAFRSVCWAWANVLVPGGATPSAAVSDTCGLPDPEPASGGGGAGPGRYYFHTLIAPVNNVDKIFVGGSSFSSEPPAADDNDPAVAMDTYFNGTTGETIYDATWSGTLSQPIASFEIDFFHKGPVQGTSTGTATFETAIWNAGKRVSLGSFTVPAPAPGEIGHVVHSYEGLNIVPAGPIQIDIKPTLDSNGPILFDSAAYPSGFTYTAPEGPINKAPTAAFTYTCAEFACSFDANSSTDSDGTIASYSWDLGDGTTASTSTIDHTYAAAGTYTVKLTVTDDQGATGTTTKQITVSKTPEAGSYPLVPNDPLFPPDARLPQLLGGQWGMRKIQAPQAWQVRDATGAGIKVAVLDTGLDLDHPDFACPGKVEVIADSDFIGDKNGPEDGNGHGTHVAGIIGACTNNGEGVVGVAPASTIMPVQVLNAAGRGTVTNTLPGAIRAATDAGAHVINMSLGTLEVNAPIDVIGGGVFPEVEKAIEYAIAEGVVVVAAAGNSSFPMCSYPAIVEDIICVGSSDNRDLNSWFGNFPVNDDNQDGLGAGLLAPGGGGEPIFCDVSGEDIISTYLVSEDGCDEGFAGYTTAFGTSMAAPHVAGAAALVYDRLAGLRTGDNGKAVVEAITSTAKDLYTRGWDPMSGYGRLNAEAAVKAVTPVEVVEPIGTSVAFVDTPGSGQYSDDVLISAKLEDESGIPVPGAELDFSLVGESGTTEWSAVTNEEGVASATRTLSEQPGSYQLFVRFEGSDTHEGSSNLTDFVIDREDTAVALRVGEAEGTGKEKSRELSATLTDADSGAGIPGREVSFYCDGTLAATATTGDDGVATATAPKNCANGSHEYQAVFEGDSYYLGSSDSETT